MCEASDEWCAAVTVEGAASMSAIADCSRDFQTWTKATGIEPKYRVGSFSATGGPLAGSPTGASYREGSFAIGGCPPTELSSGRSETDLVIVVCDTVG